jgi:hypothetical protein
VKLNGIEDVVKVESLKWGESLSVPQEFDIVIGSEITYDSSTWRVLIDTILEYTKPGSFLLLAAAPRFMEVMTYYYILFVSLLLFFLLTKVMWPI